MSTTLPEMSHEEIESLLGAYALDAVDPETTAVIEAHLEGCMRCTAEVAQHHEVAGLLANAGGPSPARLWDGIAAQLDGSRTSPGTACSAKPDEPAQTGSCRGRPPRGAAVVRSDGSRGRRWISVGAGL